MTMRYPIAGIMLGTLLWMLAATLFIGCKSAGSRIQSEIDRLPWRESAPAAEAPAELPAGERPEVPVVVPEVPVEPVAAPAAPVEVPAEEDGFLWEPRGDTVFIRIPRSLPFWQFTLVTLSPHVYIHGPMPMTKHEIVLPGSGAHWAQVASKANPKRWPSIMVYINTHALQDTGHKSAGWRILDPAKRWAGDEGTRLLKGQNK